MIKISDYLYKDKSFNLAGDFEISNRGYTDEDKQTVRHLIINGNMVSGFVTEDDHPDWFDWSIEDMYDALREKDYTIRKNLKDGDNPNPRVQDAIDEIKNQLYKSGVKLDDMGDIFDKMSDNSSSSSDSSQNNSPDSSDSSNKDVGNSDGSDSGDADGGSSSDGDSSQSTGSSNSSSGSFSSYIDPNKFKSDDAIKKMLEDSGFGKRDVKRIMKAVKEAKRIAKEEAERRRQQGSGEGEIGYRGDKESQEKEEEERRKQIEKEEEERRKQIEKEEEKAKNKDNQSDNEEPRKDETQSSDSEDEYKDYEDDYDSSKETAEQRKDRLSRITKIFSDPAVAAKIDRENRAKIQASRDAKARKELRRYMTSDAMKFQMNIKRFLNNEFGEDSETTWSRRHRANLNNPGSNRKILLPGKKIQDVERPTKPLINVYFDQSASWSQNDLKAGNQAVSQMNKLVKDGKLEVQIYYFDSELHTTPPVLQGGTRGTPIINHIKQTHPDNVIIMTDSDINDITEDVTIPGIVWMLWKNGKVSENLKQHLHGLKNTEYYNIEVN